MDFYEDKTCFYKIRVKRNHSKDFVARGSGGNILAWGENDEDQQKWLIIPTSNDRCQLISKYNSDNMAVGSNGNILCWGHKDDSDQQFLFTQAPNQPDWFNIREFTKGERVAVGSNGNILRWGKKNNSSQIFKPEEIESVAKPTPPQITITDLASIPNPPDPIERNFPPETSEKYTIGQVVMPSYAVNDPRYGNNGYGNGLIDQVLSTPYYLLKRDRYWTRTTKVGVCQVEDNSTSTDYKIKEEYSIAASTEKTTENTLSITIGIDGNVSFGSNTGSIKTSITNQLKLTQTDKIQTYENFTIDKIYTMPAGKILNVVWQLVDEYAVYRYNKDAQGTPVLENDPFESIVVETNTTIESSYNWD